MSHFTVLVIGDNPEDKLAPYHQYECTGIEAFLQFVEGDTPLETLKEQFASQNEYLSLDKYVRAEYGYRPFFFDGKDYTPVADLIEDTWLVDETGMADEQLIDYNLNMFNLKLGSDVKHPIYKGRIVYGRMTNPNYKWDWYALGGRWCNFFKLKQPNYLGEKYADSVPKSLIDFEGMRNDKGAKAAKHYDDAMLLFGEAPYIKSWKEIEAEIGEDNDTIKDLYWEQKRCKIVRNNSKFFGFLCDVTDYNVTRDEYIAAAGDEALTTYALIDENGKWHQKGKMGWWGMSNDEMTQAEWNKKYNELIDSLPPNTLLSVYDCHI